MFSQLKFALKKLSNKNKSIKDRIPCDMTVAAFLKKALKKPNLSVMIANAKKDTAFFNASKSGDIDTMTAMVLQGDVERRGNAALCESVVMNNPVVVDFLLEYGANYMATANGKNLTQISMENGYEEITMILSSGHGVPSDSENQVAIPHRLSPRSRMA